MFVRELLQNLGDVALASHRRSLHRVTPVLLLPLLMSRSLNSLSKFARPQSEIGCLSSLVSSQLLSRNVCLRYTRLCVRSEPLLVIPTACVPLRSSLGNVRHYANFPGGGMPQGFPFLGQQQQKGDALKEYVRSFCVFFYRN